MKFWFKSDVGMVRESNEDCLFVDEKLRLFIIADGMGGHRAGEIASSTAIEVVSNLLKESLKPSLDRKAIFETILNALCSAHDVISQKAQDVSLRGMGTTIVLAYCKGNDIYVANVGDSRAYLIRNERIEQVSEDHSLVAQMVKAGKISKEEARTHRFRHILSQALGTSSHLIPFMAHLTWKKGDHLLLCSDGLTDMLDDQEILSVVLKFRGDPKGGCEELIKKVNDKGGIDNITVILLYNDCVR
ncbi:MAG: Stp1/IreP family PP2C-type Ser/Thr phosphatase [Thermoproteota archaeon]|nr:MAG: Stp1/IreP family PP2C-type Ser/Thr phosphatase [Candidatus Korarchaeota archaeon]